MTKEISPSRKVGRKVLYAAFNILKQHGGTMRVSELKNTIRDTVQFTDWEKEKYEKTGYVRWESMLQFHSDDALKAGFIQKNKGLWTLTAEGEEVLKLPPIEIVQAAQKGYRAWKNTQDSTNDVAATNKETLLPADRIEISENVERELSFELQQKALLEQFEETAYTGLRKYVLSKNPYEFQDMVAALLESMGYFISHIAAKGRDGGIDIIMYTDPLGTKPPRIIVQVKHRPESSVPSDDIQRLIGTMKRDTDVGIFVTSGDFSNYAKQEARLSGKHIELIDFERFISLWTGNYYKMSDRQKNMLPLQPIYFLGVND